MVWSEQQAEAAMREERRIPQILPGVASSITASWLKINDEPRAEVLLNMAFNMGVIGVLKFRRNTLAILDGAIAGKRSYADVAKGMLNSAWARQVKGRARQLANKWKRGLTPMTLREGRGPVPSRAPGWRLVNHARIYSPYGLHCCFGHMGDLLFCRGAASCP